MIVNAGVNRISYWPADPEINLLTEASSSEDATLDAKAAERLNPTAGLMCVSYSSLWFVTWCSL